MDYKQIARDFDCSPRMADRLYKDAIKATSKMTGERDQNTIESTYSEYLLDAYTDLLRKCKENIMKGTALVEAFIKDEMDLEEAIDSYSQSIIKPNTVKGKDLEEADDKKDKEDDMSDEEKADAKDKEDKETKDDKKADKEKKDDEKDDEEVEEKCKKK